MALAYGTAQILAPALTGYLADQFGNYDLGLYLSSGVMLVGLIVILFLLRIEKPPIKNKIPDKPKFVSS
jgi:MFS family permease